MREVLSKTRGITAITVLAMALAGCSGASGADDRASNIEEMDALTLTFADVTTEESPAGHAAKEFSRIIEEGSGGKITVENYFSSSLLTGEEILDGIKSGTADLGLINSSYFSEEFPQTNAYNDLGHLAGGSFPTSNLALTAAAYELHLSDSAPSEEYERNGLKVLTAGSTGSYKIVCNTPVNSAADAKGLTVRVGGEPWLSEVRAMGMEPVSLSTNEVYEGLQRGVIDCASFTPYTMKDFGILEVAKHFLPVDMGSNVVGLGMNLDTWEKLPDDAKKLIEDAAREYWLNYYLETISRNSEFGSVHAREFGLQASDVRELNEMLATFRQGEVNGSPDLALSEHQVIDYKALVDKWTNVFENEFGFDSSTVDDPSSTFEQYAKYGNVENDIRDDLRSILDEQIG
jgi:TRAP-type C4-dicarboxylate transport system substrate-binding protein